MQIKKIKNRIPELKLSKIIHLLGNILGLVIKKQEGISFFNKVEKIRILSKESRSKKSEIEINKIFKKLKSNISKLSYRESLIIARSFSQFLNFSNLSESLYSVHKIHNYDIRETQVTNEFVILEDIITRLLKHKSISRNQFL